MATGRAPLGETRWHLLHFVLILGAAISGSAITSALQKQDDLLAAVAFGLIAAASLIGVGFGTRILARPYRTAIVRGQGPDRGLRRAGWYAYVPIAFAVAFLVIAVAQHFNVI